MKSKSSTFSNVNSQKLNNFSFQHFSRAEEKHLTNQSSNKPKHNRQLLYQLYNKQLKNDKQTLRLLDKNYQQFSLKQHKIMQLVRSLSIQRNILTKNIQKYEGKNQRKYNFDERTMAETIHKKHLDFVWSLQQEQEKQNSIRNFSFGMKKNINQSPVSNRTFIMDLQDLIN